MTRDIGRGDSHGANLAQQLDGNGVQRHAQHHGAAGIAEVPRQGRCLRNDNGQTTRPEGLHQVTRGIGIGSNQTANGIPGTHQYWHRHIWATLFGGQEVGYGIVIKGIAAEAIERIGGHDHKATGLRSLDRNVHALFTLGIIGAVKNLSLHNLFPFLPSMVS